MNINKEIVARAMDKAGEEPITSDEWTANKSNRIRLIKDYYLPTILETLSNTAWTSQKKRVQLTENLDENLTSYTYKYALPIDCAKPVEINGVEVYLVEDGYIYTDIENPILVYISNHFTGEFKYEETEVTEESFESGKYYYLDDEENYILATEFDETKTYYVRIEEDYNFYDDFNFDPLLSEYIETRLAAKIVLKLTGNMQLYQLLYSESIVMENRAVKASIAHGYNKDKGNKYWGEILGLPDYEDTTNVNY